METRRIAAALLCVSWGMVPAQASPAPRPVPSSRIRINPLALEYRLLAYLAEQGDAEARKEAKERSVYMDRFGGKGYTVHAVAPGRDVAVTQHKLRQNAYLALTEPPIRDAQDRVKEFSSRERIPIKPPRGKAASTDRAHPILGLIDGVNLEISRQNENIRAAEARPRGTPLDHALVRDQVAMHRRRIEMLSDLNKNLAGLVKPARAFDALGADIRGLAKAEARDVRTAELQGRADAVAAGNPRISAAEAVGTQQVRFTVTEEARDAIRSALAGVLEPEKMVRQRKIGFIRGSLSFLPAVWPLDKPALPAGDFRMTEIVCGEELVLTLFDCAGLWHRMVALEYAGALHLLVPEPRKPGTEMAR